MIQAVPPLNIVVSAFYFVTATLTFVVLKYSFKAQPRPSNQQQSSSQTQQVALPMQKLLVLSWVKNYSILGGLFSRDKKYLLKQLLIVSVYGVSCLTINRIIIWPLAFIGFLLPICFIVLDLGVKIMQKKLTDQPVSDAGDKKVHQVPIGSELDIQVVNIQTKRPYSAESSSSTNKVDKTIFQKVLIAAVCIISIVLLLQTALTISKSISNSGYLNIVSLLIIVSLDQFAVRPATGLILLATVKIIQSVSQIQLPEVSLAHLVCQQQINVILVQAQKQREKKRRERLMNSPVKQAQSLSRIQNVLASPQQPTYMNLISLQQTVQPNQQEKDEVIEQIDLMCVQQEATPNSARADKKPKPNKSHLCYTQRRNKFLTIEQQKPGFDDIMILNDGPLHEKQDNIIAEFNMQDSPQHKGKPKIQRKAKRQLNLSGSSPYLEYLPDMLKKVQGYKQNKQNNNKLKKML